MTWTPYSPTTIATGRGAAVASDIASNFTTATTAFNAVALALTNQGAQLDGKGTIVSQTLTATGGTCSLPSGYIALIDGRIIATTGAITQGYSAGSVNYVYLTTSSTLRVSTTNSEGSTEALIATVDASGGGEPTVNMSPTGKKVISPYNLRSSQFVIPLCAEWTETPGDTNWINKGRFYLYWEPSKWPTMKAAYFEAVVITASGAVTASARLYDLTAGAAITGTTLESTATDADLAASRQRSGNIMANLPAVDSHLCASLKTATGTTGVTVVGARLIIECSDYRTL